MNTKKQDRNNQRQKTRQKPQPKKQGQKRSMLNEDLRNREHEHPETRLTR